MNKDVSPWAKDFLEKELVGLEAEENGVSAKVDSILSMDGDVDVSQRKGKVITLFDVKLKIGIFWLADSTTPSQKDALRHWNR